MVMAFAGASPAMAGTTLLCLNDTQFENPTEAECNPPAAVHYLSVKVTLDANGVELTEDAKIKLLAAGFPTVECNLLVQGTVLDKLVTNGPVRISVAAAGLVYTNCNNGCVVTVHAGGTLLVLRTGVELARVTGDGFMVELDCPFYECDYNWEGLEGHGLGPLFGDTGSKGHITYTAAVLRLERDLESVFGSCPAETFMDALLQSLTAVYIRT
jgi:hypothetical protein